MNVYSNLICSFYINLVRLVSQDSCFDSCFNVLNKCQTPVFKTVVSLTKLKNNYL